MPEQNISLNLTHNQDLTQTELSNNASVSSVMVGQQPFGTTMDSFILTENTISPSPSKSPNPVSYAEKIFAAPEAGGLLTALESVDPEIIKKDVYYLASKELAGRDTGSDGMRQAAQYIDQRLHEMGWEYGGSQISHYNPYSTNLLDPLKIMLGKRGKKHKYTSKPAPNDLSCSDPEATFPTRKKGIVNFLTDVSGVNVVGFWEGHDPNLKDEIVIISAHYDHKGTKKNGEYYPGANDNASGTAGLLALAKSIPILQTGRSVLLLFNSGEELIMRGSTGWAKSPYLPEGKRVVANINLDMIGRGPQNEIHVTPSKKHKVRSPLAELFEQSTKAEGFQVIKSADSVYARSDHIIYSHALNIPIVFAFSGHSKKETDYHQTTDTPEKVDYDKVARVTKSVLRTLSAMDGYASKDL